MMEVNAERIEEKSVVFKNLLETKLEKSTIWLILPVFVVHHHCVGRRIHQRSLLQNNRENLCPSSMVKETKTSFQSYRPSMRRSQHHCVILTL